MLLLLQLNWIKPGILHLFLFFCCWELHPSASSPSSVTLLTSMLSWSTNTFFSQFIILVKHFFSTWLVWAGSPMLDRSSSAASLPTRARNSGTADGCTHTCTRYEFIFCKTFTLQRTVLYLPIHCIIYSTCMGLVPKNNIFFPCFSSNWQKSIQKPLMTPWEFGTHI